MVNNCVAVAACTTATQWAYGARSPPEFDGADFATPCVDNIAANRGAAGRRMKSFFAGVVMSFVTSAAFAQGIDPRDIRACTDVGNDAARLAAELLGSPREERKRRAGELCLEDPEVLLALTQLVSARVEAAPAKARDDAEFFFEYLDNRVKTPEEIEQELGLPSLGLIPMTAGVAGKANPLISDSAPPNGATSDLWPCTFTQCVLTMPARAHCSPQWPMRPM